MTLNLDTDSNNSAPKADRLTPEQRERYLKIDPDNPIALNVNELTPEQRERFKICKWVDASDSLEGFAPLSEVGGFSYELAKHYILGNITSEEQSLMCLEHYKDCLID